MGERFGIDKAFWLMDRSMTRMEARMVAEELYKLMKRDADEQKTPSGATNIERSRRIPQMLNIVH